MPVAVSHGETTSVSLSDATLGAFSAYQADTSGRVVADPYKPGSYYLLPEEVYLQFGREPLEADVDLILGYTKSFDNIDDLFAELDEPD